MIRADVIPARPSDHRRTQLIPQHFQHVLPEAFGRKEVLRRRGELVMCTRVPRRIRKGGGSRGQDSPVDALAKMFEEAGEEIIGNGGDAGGGEDVDGGSGAIAVVVGRHGDEAAGAKGSFGRRA